MTKADLVVDVMRPGRSDARTDAETIIETIFDSVVAALRSGDKIEIRGFGSFRTRQRNPRIGLQPQDRCTCRGPRPSGFPTSKPSKDLRDLVNHQAAAGPLKPPRPLQNKLQKVLLRHITGTFLSNAVAVRKLHRELQETTS